MKDLARRSPLLVCRRPRKIVVFNNIRTNDFVQVLHPLRVSTPCRCAAVQSFVVDERAYQSGIKVLETECTTRAASHAFGPLWDPTVATQETSGGMLDPLSKKFCADFSSRVRYGIRSSFGLYSIGSRLGKCCARPLARQQTDSDHLCHARGRFLFLFRFYQVQIAMRPIS